jgi:hypothetical protein
MSTAIIALLFGLSFYLGARLHAVTAENSVLRASIVRLKRRMDQP